MSDINKQLTELEKTIFNKNTHTVERGGVIEVWLDSDQQHFKLAVQPEDSKHAEWHRRQLAIALAKITKATKEPSTADTIEWVENNTQSCHNNSSIFDTSRYVKKDDLLAHLQHKEQE